MIGISLLSALEDYSKIDLDEPLTVSRRREFELTLLIALQKTPKS